MLDHAFTELGLHRVALTVFAFNERAVRSYRSVGFVLEGRAREAIWREGRWWDEISMSLLDSEWATLNGRDVPEGAARREDVRMPPVRVRRRPRAMAEFLGRRR
jgi:hypothetical protein